MFIFKETETIKSYGFRKYTDFKDCFPNYVMEYILPWAYAGFAKGINLLVVWASCMPRSDLLEGFGGMLP